MYLTSINDKQVVIRFSLLYKKRDVSKEEQIIHALLDLGESLLSYVSECIAVSDGSDGLIIVYVQDGEVLDVQIQQVVPSKNIIN
ncbi:hypothetical protein ACOI1C_17045 [Bacillus sp. DJP31]|uniref:hypothetical protein n=1 Tax=Bacillus sp. DJP31 TaxID=3409789 RepID=UPI003BB796CA